MKPERNRSTWLPTRSRMPASAAACSAIALAIRQPIAGIVTE
jgi:hypothetical protein